MSLHSNARLRRSARDAVPIGEVLRSMSDSLDYKRQAVAAVQETFSQILPAELALQMWVQGLHAGVVTIAVPDAASKCLVEAGLRGGGLVRLQEALPSVPVTKVRVILGSGLSQSPNQA